MELSNWLAFLLISLAATFTPGPAVLLAISSSVALGPRRTLYGSAGNALGVFLVALVAVTGLGLVLQTSAIAFGVLKVLGAAYLIYLGVRQWRRKPDPVQQDAQAAATVSSRSGVFLRGLLVALTNPKAILFFTAVFPQFMQSGSLDPARFMLLTSTFVACVLISHMFYVLLAARLGSRFTGPARMRNVNRASGLVFMGLGCALLTLSRRQA